MAKATLTYNQSADKWEAKFNGMVLIASPSKQYVENAVRSGLNRKCKKLNIDGFINDEIVQTETKDAINEMFSINERFEMLEQLTGMVAAGTAKSLIVTGSGGLGKTHTILTTLASHGLTSSDEAGKFDAKTLFPDEVEKIQNRINECVDHAVDFYSNLDGEDDEEGLVDAEMDLGAINDLQYPSLEVNNLDMGKTLGTANSHTSVLSINFAAYMHNKKEFMDVVIPHEVAHFVVNVLYKDAKAHGKEFRKVMQDCFDLPGTANTLISDNRYVETNMVWSNPGDFVVIKGYSTAKGLYKSLYYNRDKIVICDDCDSVWKDPVSLNLMKAALDSYDKRIVTWNADIDDMPTSFEFTGRMIFISNLSQNDLSQAVKSRSLRVDLSMTPIEKVERMESIVNSEGFMPEASITAKREALAFIKEHANIATDLNIRTLMQVITLRVGAKSNWSRLAYYTITA